MMIKIIKIISNASKNKLNLVCFKYFINLF